MRSCCDDDKAAILEGRWVPHQRKKGQGSPRKIAKLLAAMSNRDRERKTAGQHHVGMKKCSRRQGFSGGRDEEWRAVLLVVCDLRNREPKRGCPDAVLHETS